MFLHPLSQLIQSAGMIIAEMIDKILKGAPIRNFFGFETKPFFESESPVVQTDQFIVGSPGEVHFKEPETLGVILI